MRGWGLFVVSKESNHPTRHSSVTNVAIIVMSVVKYLHNCPNTHDEKKE